MINLWAREISFSAENWTFSSLEREAISLVIFLKEKSLIVGKKKNSNVPDKSWKKWSPEE